MRRLVWLVALILVLFLTGCTTPEAGEYGSLRWSLDRWGTLTIEGEGAIPAYPFESDEKPPWYHALGQASRLVIGEGITEIGKNAFSAAPQLKRVELPNSLTRIEKLAFFCCLKLENIALPNSITYLGSQAFSQCDALTEFRVPAGVTEVTADIISMNDNVRKLYLPAGLKWIESGFGDCPALEEIIVDEANPNLMSRDGVVFSADGTTLCAYPAGKQDTVYVVPEGVTTIGKSAFEYAKFLTEVILPQELVTISDIAFADCKKLTTVHLSQTLETIGKYAFSSCYALAKIDLPKGVRSIGKSAFAWCEKLEKIALPAQMTEIPDHLFINCRSLSSITYPDGIMSIGVTAFFGCDSLTTVYIPSTVKMIDSTSFGDCAKLTAFVVDEANTEYTAKDGVLFTADGKTLVCYPTGRTALSYHVPEGVTHIAPYAFYIIRELETLTMADTVQILGEYSLYACPRLGDVTVSAQVTELPECSLVCTNLNTLTLPVGLLCVGEDAFYGVEFIGQIYFTGTEAQWNAIEIADGNDVLSRTEIVFGSTKSE